MLQVPATPETVDAVGENGIVVDVASVTIGMFFLSIYICKKHIKSIGK